MESGVIFLSFLLLIAQVLLLIFNCRTQKLWGITFAVEILSLMGAVIAAVVFDRLTGKGIMPGITYFAEWMISVGAAVVYTIMLLLTVVLRMVRRT